MTSNAPPIAQVESFAQQLEAQAGQYHAILVIGERQQEALARHDLVGFHELLGQKATLLGDIADREQQAAANRAAWEAHREELPTVLRERVRRAVAEIRGLLERLLAMERACEAQLAATKQDVERELRHLGRGQQALQSYRPPPTDAPRGTLDLGG